MKLNAAQLPNVEQQLGVEALPEEHPVMPKLVEAFGEHTFFVDAAGLHIVEVITATETSSGTVVRLARWAGEERDKLEVHEPEALAVSVDLKAGEPDPAA